MQGLFSNPYDYSTGTGGGGGSGGSNSYSTADPFNPYGSDPTPSSSPVQPDKIVTDYSVKVDLEKQAANDPIDIESYLKCFSAIPDDGSNCSIEIFADIPVESDPNKLLNVTTGSPGHTFFTDFRI